MAFCINCGAELTSADVFCPVCGTKNEITEEVVQDAEPAAPAPELSKEESIVLAEKLEGLYKSYERLKKEIEDNKSQISRSDNGPVKQHAAFKFFWPFLIYAAVSYYFFYFFGSLMSNSTRSAGPAIFALLLAIAAPIALLIIGGVTSVRKRNALNQAAIEAAQNRRKHLDDLKKETSALDTKRAKKAAELKEYDYLVPASLRNSSSMAKAALILKSDKAQTFSQAIEMLHKV